MDITFQEPAPYGIVALVVPPTYCALSDALTSRLEALALAGAAAGLPDVHLAPEATLRGGQLRTLFVVVAGQRNQSWDRAPVLVKGATLAEAEQKFYAGLATWQASQQPLDECAADAAIAHVKEEEAYA